MLYDQAEAVMADLAETYPTREVGMVLRGREDANAPRDYAIQIAHDGASIVPAEIDAYAAIARKTSEANPDLKPVDVKFDASARIVVVFD